MWECLIETIKARRVIQNEMSSNHKEAINSLYSYLKYDKKHSLTAEELESFINGMLRNKLSKQKISCLMKALDRDEDNLVSYSELQDSIFGTY